MLSTFNLIVNQARTGQDSLEVIKMALAANGMAGGFGETPLKPGVSCYHIKQMKPHASNGF